MSDEFSPTLSDPDDDTADEIPDDPTDAAVRTSLAWGRSTMALFACGAVVAKGVPSVTGDGRPFAGVAMLVLGGLVWLSGLPFARSRHHESGVRRTASAIELAPLACGTAVVGAAAFVIAAFFPG